MKNKVIKGLIAPLQKVLMQKRFCPACTRNLNRAKVIGQIEADKVIVCECGRIFVFETELDTYRRALPDEVKSMQ